MRATVLRDPALVKQAGRFAWLAIDTEKPANAGFLEKYPVNAWPTYMVINPAAETIALRWYGSATVPNFVKLLEDGDRAVTGKLDGPDAILARADRLNGERKFAEAAAAYREALNAGGDNWERRARTIESLAMALQFARHREECARTVIDLAPSLPRGPSFANSVATGLTCAVNADEKAGWRLEALRRLQALGQEALKLPGLLGDDRSSLYDSMIGLADALKDEAAAGKLAAEWFEFLEHERQRGATAEQRAANDGHRVTAALRLGDPARAIPALEASERELTNDYNPPARLAVLYREAGRYKDAIAASDRALSKAYGPRKALVYSQRAVIYEKMGDKAGARRALEEGLAFARTLPSGEASIARLEKQLAELK